MKRRKIDQKELIDDIKEVSQKAIDQPQKNNLISTGSDLFDLVAGGGYPVGKIVNIVGDNSTGKTLLAIECIAKARHRYGDKLKWFYDDAEAGFSFPTMRMYGFNVVRDTDKCSYTLEDFQMNIRKELNRLKADEILIYVLDCLDSLTTEEEIAFVNEKLKAVEKGKKSPGSYGQSKQKGLSEFFRMMRREIRDKNCLLIIVSQVRTNIGVMFGPKYIRVGGKALDFYASQIFWLAVAEKYKKKDRSTGVCIKAKNTKNKIGKPYRECYIDILFEYGVDNISSNLKFLYDLKTPKGKDKENLDGLKWDSKEYSLRALIRHIETKDQIIKLRDKVIDQWKCLEEKIDPLKGRKKKYDIHRD